MTKLLQYDIIKNVKLTLLFRRRLHILNNKVAELRKERKITQQALADLLEVSRQTVISLENGRYNPSIMLAHKIAVTFGLTIEEVFIFEEE